MRVFKRFTFEAAHSLPHLPEGHECRNIHGHSYQVEISVYGHVGEDGFVIDYADIAKAWEPLHAQLDHHNLDEIIKPYSTCEFLAGWIWVSLKPQLRGLYEVKVQETPTAGVVYQGEGLF